MTNFEYVVIILLAILVVAISVWVLILIRRKPGDGDSAAMQLLQQQVASALQMQDKRLGQIGEQLQNVLRDFNSSLNQRMGQNQVLAQQMQKTMSERLETAGKTMADLREQLGQLGQATQTVAQVGSEVKKLQDILQRPGIRGGLGEWTLEQLLADILPREYYELNHRFNNGMIVDALVRLVQGQVAIDAKFPLANFKLMLDQQNPSERLKIRRIFLRDVQKRIDEIATKYILPEEGTLDFALMFVPAENVYYETIIQMDEKDLDIGQFSRERKVIPVSPNTLYAYLMVIATGLQGLQIEKNAQVIRNQLSQISENMNLFQADFILLGKHLSNSKNKFDDAEKKLVKYITHLRGIDGGFTGDSINTDRE